MTNTVDVKIDRRYRLLYVLSGATFLIFFQAFMVAPIIPKLSSIFGVPVESIGLIVPAYLIPYGIFTLIYGPLSDRLGRSCPIRIWNPWIFTRTCNWTFG